MFFFLFGNEMCKSNSKQIKHDLLQSEKHILSRYEYVRWVVYMWYQHSSPPPLCHHLTPHPVPLPHICSFRCFTYGLGLAPADTWSHGFTLFFPMIKRREPSWRKNQTRRNTDRKSDQTKEANNDTVQQHRVHQLNSNCQIYSSDLDNK